MSLSLNNASEHQFGESIRGQSKVHRLAPLWLIGVIVSLGCALACGGLLLAVAANCADNRHWIIESYRTALFALGVLMFVGSIPFTFLSLWFSHSP